MFHMFIYIWKFMIYIFNNVYYGIYGGYDSGNPRNKDLAMIKKTLRFSSLAWKRRNYVY